jgi:hypothetical protein
MSKISHHNIEEWLFNFAEGNLNAAEVKELKAFIQANPQYADELEFWQQTKIQESVPEFNNDNLHEIANLQVKGFKRTIALLSLIGIMGIALVWYYIVNNHNSPNNTFNNNLKTSNIISANNSNKQINTLENNSSEENYSAPTILENNNSINASDNKVDTKNKKNIEAYQTTYKAQRKAVSTSINNNYAGPQNPVSQAYYSANNNTQQNIVFNDNDLSNNAEINNANTGNNISEKVEKIKHRNNIYEGFRKTYLKPDFEYISQKNQPVKFELSEQKKNNKKFFDYELGFYNSKNIYLLHIENNLLNEYAASAGSGGTGNLQLNYLNRYTGSAQNNMAYMAAIDFYSKKINSGFALLTRYQEIGNGKIDNLQVNLLYSYKIKIDRYNLIEAGVGIGYNQINNSINYGNTPIEVTPGNIYITAGNNQAGFRKLQLSPSAIYHSKYFYALAGTDIIPGKNTLRINEYTVYNGHLPAKIKTTVGTDFKPYYDNRWSVSPQISYIHRGKQNEFWLGGVYRYSGAGIGLSVASNKQIMGCLSFMYDKFMLGYNINYGKSYFNNQYYLTHEANIRIAFNALEKKKVAILDSEK